MGGWPGGISPSSCARAEPPATSSPAISKIASVLRMPLVLTQRCAALLAELRVGLVRDLARRALDASGLARVRRLLPRRRVLLRRRRDRGRIDALLDQVVAREALGLRAERGDAQVHLAHDRLG